MAKCRFPGKALKLKSRKRVKFRGIATHPAEINEEDTYSRKIAQGFQAFKNLFGESEEDDGLDFEGFNFADVEKGKLCNKLISFGYAKKYVNKDVADNQIKYNDTVKRKDGRYEIAASENNIITSRSSRVIKQPKRFVEDCSNYNEDFDYDETHQKKSVGRPRKGPSLSGLGFPSEHVIPTPGVDEGDKVYKNISLYADTISTQPAAEHARVTRRNIQTNEVQTGLNSSSGSGASNKLQEKIKKLLQTQWDGRSKQPNSIIKSEVSEEPPSKTSVSHTNASVLASKNVLRKAKLQLNKRVLQKIRNPVSVQHLLHSTEDSPISTTLSDQATTTTVPAVKTFQTQKLDGGWTRKIRWNADGTGRVTIVTTPAGSKVDSLSELQGYLKKEGLSTKDASYYFAHNLNREDVPVCNVTPKVIKRKKPTNASVNAEKKSVKKNVCNKQLAAKSGGNKANVDTGPRIKRVCRSLEQALGMPRATFPTPEDKENKEVLLASGNEEAEESDSQSVVSSTASISEDSKESKPFKIPKVFSIKTTSSGKILRKVLWCNRCSGCLTPNCRKCGHCIDMIKYGGLGTKKKPCIMRKCLNPRVPSIGKKSDDVFTSSAVATTTNSNKNKQDKKLPVISSTKQTLKRSFPGKKPKKILEDCDNNNVLVESSKDKSSVFVPGQLRRQNLEITKELSESCKKTLPSESLMVEIDYWRPYDTPKVLMQGFPVLQGAPLHLTTLCFRCGAGGEEEMLYCSYCCEGIHIFCMEEGEGPLSSKDASQWVCRRCAVCHVCGTSGSAGTKMDDLNRCSSCQHYYHLECLGPEAHKNCMSPTDALWELEMKTLVQTSIPHPPPLYSVENFDHSSTNALNYDKVDDINSSLSLPTPNYVHPTVTKNMQTTNSSLSNAISNMICYRLPNVYDETPFKLHELPHFKQLMLSSKPTEPLDVTLITELESNDYKEIAGNTEPICFVLPKCKNISEKVHSNSEGEDLAAVTCVTDDMMDMDFTEMVGLDLDAIMEDLDDNDEVDVNILDTEYDEEDVIELYPEYNLYPDMKNIKPNISKGEIDPNVASMNDDEYLALGYKKFTVYKNEDKCELSSVRLTQMVQVELFNALKWPHMNTLIKKNILRPKRRGKHKISHAKVTAPIRDDSDTDSASEGLSESEDEVEIKKKKKIPKELLETFELRRIEILGKLKEKSEKMKLSKKKSIEIEDEKLRILKENIKREKIRTRLTKWTKTIDRELIKSKEISSYNDRRLNEMEESDEEFKVSGYINNSINKRKRALDDEFGTVEENKSLGCKTKKLKKKKLYHDKNEHFVNSKKIKSTGSNNEISANKKVSKFVKKILNAKELADDEIRKTRQQKLLEATIESILKRVNKDEKIQTDQTSSCENKVKSDENNSSKNNDKLPSEQSSSNCYSESLNLNGSSTIIDDKICNDQNSSLDNKIEISKSAREDGKLINKNTKLNENGENFVKSWPTLAKLKQTLLLKSHQPDAVINATTKQTVGKIYTNGNEFELDEKHNTNICNNEIHTNSDNKNETKSTNEDIVPEKYLKNKSRLSNGDSRKSLSEEETGEYENRRKSRRSLGRASELASLRKAKLDM